MRDLRLTPDGRLADRGLLEEPRLAGLLEVLNPEGEESRLIGGAVRNALVGLPAGDIDLATTMLPAQVIERARAARLRSIPTGIAHGTVTVMAQGRPFEVTTLRQDIETDGRHAVVRFGRDFETDARRRDFTMNALSLGRDGQIFDSVGGVRDLACGRVRFIGDAATRIKEDYLRILRFFRFHAAYGSGPLDPEGLAATIANRDGLARLSRERVRAETFKILAATGVLEVLRAMDGAEILPRLAGQGTKLERLARLIGLETAQADPLLRLAALALHGPEDAERLRERLRLSNAETARLKAAIAARSDVAERQGPPESADLRRLLFAHGRQAAIDGLALAYASHPAAGDAPAWQAAAGSLLGIAVPVLPVSGDDLMSHGLKGAAVGRALARLRDRWAGAGFPGDPATLAALIEEAVGPELPS